MKQVSAQKNAIKARRKWNGKSFWRLLLIVIVIGYFGYLTFNYLEQRIITQMIKVKPLEISTINDTVEINGILIKDEVIINSPYQGKVKFNIQEGDRVRAGAIVASVTAVDINNKNGQTTYNINAPTPGVISFHLDGLENIYTKANVNNILMQKLAHNDSKPLSIKNDDMVESGRPIFKIVNNLSRNIIYFQVPLKDIPTDFLKKGHRIELMFVEKDVAAMYFEIDDIKQINQDLSVVVSNNSFTPQFLDQRDVNIKIVRNTYSDKLVVSLKSLVKKNDQNGLFIQYKEAVKWVPVEVLGIVKDKVAIKGLNNYLPQVIEGTPYIVNPEITKNGQVLY